MFGGRLLSPQYLECSKSLEDESKIKLQSFADQLATHITGMQPKFILSDFKKLPYTTKMKEMVIEFGEGA